MTEYETTANARPFRAQYLAAEIPDQLSDRVFGYAWREGHASGWGDVELIYDDLADLVNAAYLAGKEAGA